jgi:pyruvate/2-oxoglutarate/acetoin dehydrogenase E1 component
LGRTSPSPSAAVDFAERAETFGVRGEEVGYYGGAYAVTRGQISVPMVLRTQGGTGRSAKRASIARARM